MGGCRRQDGCTPTLALIGTKVNLRCIGPQTGLYSPNLTDIEPRELGHVKRLNTTLGNASIMPLPVPTPDQ